MGSGDLEPHRDKAMSVRKSFIRGKIDLLLPSLWIYEVGNILGRHCPLDALLRLEAPVGFSIPQADIGDGCLEHAMQMTIAHKSFSRKERCRMFVSGFTFCRNLVKLDYPFEESIRSLLPLVDEFVIAVGDSEDDTLARIEKIGDPRIKIIRTVWDMSLKKDGLIYAQQTNIALENCNPDGDWAIYLQGDEVLHENDYEGIRSAMEQYRNDRDLLGLMMRYYHFVGDYSSTDPWAYRRSLRIVRPGGVVTSIGDAVGFARSSDNLYIGKKEKKYWRYAPGYIYHYGWVKDPRLLREKVANQVSWYWEGTPNERDRKVLALKEFMPENYDILKPFRGTHPGVMKERVASFPDMPGKRSRWLNPKFYKYVLKHGFKG